MNERQTEREKEFSYFHIQSFRSSGVGLLLSLRLLRRLFWRLQEVRALGQNVVVAHGLATSRRGNNRIEGVRGTGLFIFLSLSHHFQNLHRY